MKIKVKYPDYVLVECDLSGAECRTSAAASKDQNMLQAYREGKDLYSFIASKIYNNKYEDNLEFYPEGIKIMFEGKEVVTGKKTHVNKSGKIRRQDSKSILIGLIYGRGINSIKDQINESRRKINQPLVTKEDTQELLDSIYKSFPRLKIWMDETHNFIHKNGYIEDAFGRRRRLPDAMLPKYDIKYIGAEDNSSGGDFNPFLNCKNRANNPLIEKYANLLKKVYSQKEYKDIQKRALVEGVEIHDNTGYISQAERQSVNFQAQSASSGINKKSMIAIDKDERLIKLGFHLLLTIHDEVIGECPKENAEEVAKIIPQIMTTVGSNKVNCPLVADSSYENHWYELDNIAFFNEAYNKYTKDKGLSHQEAIDRLIKEHSEFLPEQISNLLNGKSKWLW